MRVLVVGLNPSKSHGNSQTLITLYKWLDELGIQHVSFTNLYSGYKIRREDLQSDFVTSIAKDYDRILALGNTVSNALHSLAIDHFKLPHPSGLNRALNDKNYVHDQLKACKNYLKGNP